MVVVVVLLPSSFLPSSFSSTLPSFFHSSSRYFFFFPVIFHFLHTSPFSFLLFLFSLCVSLLFVVFVLLPLIITISHSGDSIIIIVSSIILDTFVIFIIFTGCLPRSGELRTQKLKSHLLRTQSLHVLPLKPGVGQYITIHATLTARDFFRAYFYPFGPVTCICFQNLSRFFLALAVAYTGSCVGPQNKIGHPAGCRFPC